MTKEKQSSHSYNEYINGSRFRFLPFNELKLKHVIITHMKTEDEIAIIREFYEYHDRGKYIRGRKGLFYNRFRPIKDRPGKTIFTYAPQTKIREMCEPDSFGIPDMLFTYKEFLEHYIEPEEYE